MKDKRLLADSIPNSIKEKIYQNGTENFERVVYRAAKYGEINEKAFMNSLDEYKYEKRKFRNDLEEIGSYSTSCYVTKDEPQVFIGNLKKKYFDKYPRPVVIAGHTLGGLSQRTKDRIADYQNENHYDWWIYQDEIENVIKDFSIVDDDKEE